MGTLELFIIIRSKVSTIRKDNLLIGRTRRVKLNSVKIPIAI